MGRHTYTLSITNHLSRGSCQGHLLVGACAPSVHIILLLLLLIIIKIIIRINITLMIIIIIAILMLILIIVIILITSGSVPTVEGGRGWTG